ncbi:MAG: hypothetical protein K2W82_18060 [Candidatus Obscuribacterales bacterium]|nr:hypothetical protein [Candidatus Obscuribacterales bacterium]
MSETNDLFIQLEPSHPAYLEALQQGYNTLVSLVPKAKELHSALVKANGQRVEKTEGDADKRRQLYYQRSRAADVVFLRFGLVMAKLKPLLEPFLQMINAGRESQKELILNPQYAPGGGGYTNRVIAMNNLTAAEELYDQGCALCFKYGEYLGWPTSSGVEEAFKQRPTVERHYVVLSSAGNYPPLPGDDAVFNGPFSTLAEAEKEIAAWESHADTVGGTGLAYDLNKHAEYVAQCKAKRAAVPTHDQQTLIKHFTDYAEREINLKRQIQQPLSQETIICIQCEDEVVLLRVAVNLREKGWKVRDHFQHRRHKYQLYVTK